MDGEEAPAATCLAGRDGWLAALLGGLALILYAASAQARVYGHDGAFLINAFAAGVEGHSNSALYASAAAVAGRLLGRDDPLGTLTWISILGAAIGVAGVYLLARATGATLRGALVGAGLFGLAPVTWFFATTVETHGLHLGAVTLAALVCVLGPWQRRALARALVFATFVAVYLTHMTGLLLAPGWVLLAGYGAARRRGQPEARRELLWNAAVLALATVLAVALANLLFGAGFRLFAAEESPTRFLEQFRARFRLEALWGGWALALFVLLPAAVLALAAGARAAGARTALVTLVAVPTVVLLWLSIPERGAYFLGSAPFLAVLAAHLPLARGATGALTALALVALQAVAGRGELAAWDRMFPLHQRVELVREHLGEGGVLITLNPNVPRSSAFVPEVVDYDLAEVLVQHEALGTSPSDFARFLEGEIRRVFPARAVALDLSHRHVYEAPPDPDLVLRLEPYLMALERHLPTAFETRLVPHAWWPLLVLER